MDGIQLAPISADFSSADLGDARLTSRLMKIADAVAKAPGAGFPEQAGSEGELEAIYRFLNNERVRPEDVLDAHVRSTVRRAQVHERVLVVHDTTEFEFGGEQLREGLGWLNYEARQGFLGHFSFATTTEGEPLGTVGLHAWNRTGKPKGRRSQQASQYAPDRESLRWQDAALLTGELLCDKTNVLHVMDREGDCFELFAMLLEHDQQFLIRLSHDRRLSAGRSHEAVKLFEALSQDPLFFEREVPISARGNRKRSGKLKTHPARQARTAQLEVRAACHEVYVGNGNVAHVPRKLRLQFVEVREVAPPEGEAPVLWRLVTTEPVNTEEDVRSIVDAYCARWQIEEFFKALKTGCRYQQRQLETAHGLLVDLVIEAAVAWQLLLLRWFARTEPTAEATKVLTTTQIAALRALVATRKRTLPPTPTVTEALYAIAAVGGHIKNNGSPGWLVLRRGLEKLLTAEQVLIATQMPVLAEK